MASTFDLALAKAASTPGSSTANPPALGSAISSAARFCRSASETFAAGPVFQTTLTRSVARAAATKLEPSTTTQPGTVPEGSVSARVLRYPGTALAALSSIETTTESLRVGGSFGRA